MRPATLEAQPKATRKLNKLMLKIDRHQLPPEDVKKLEAASRNIKSSE